MATLITVDETSNVAKNNLLGFTSYTATERKYEPQTQNTFSFQFLFDEGQVAYIAASANRHLSPMAGGEEISLDKAHGLAQINEALNASIQNISSPAKNIGQITVDFFNSQIKYAGKPTYSNANITFNTFIGLGTKNILSAWSEIAQNDRNLAGGWARSKSSITMPNASLASTDVDQYLDALFPQIGYKCDGLLLECARDGTIVNQWKYIGMWLSTFTPGSYTMAGSNSPSQVSGTITVDRIEPANTTVISSLAYAREHSILK